MTHPRTVLRHITDEGARLRPINSRGDALAEKESVPMSFPFPHPRFPGKSHEYVASYLACEAKSAAERGGGSAPRSDATERRDVVAAAREDADARADAENRRRLAAPYYESFGEQPPPVEHFTPPKPVRHDAADPNQLIQGPPGCGMVTLRDWFGMQGVQIVGDPPLRTDADDRRVDSAAREAGVPSQEVQDWIRMNVRRDRAPTDEQIANAVHAAKLRNLYKPGASF
jgi:hypothetical protein